MDLLFDFDDLKELIKNSMNRELTSRQRVFYNSSDFVHAVRQLNNTALYGNVNFSLQPEVAAALPRYMIFALNGAIVLVIDMRKHVFDMSGLEDSDTGDNYVTEPFQTKWPILFNQ